MNKTKWSLGSIEQTVYSVFQNHPNINLNDINQIAGLSKLTRLEVSVAIQLLKYKKMI